RSGRALVPGIAAAWDRRANRRFAKSHSAGATTAPRTARFTVPAAGDPEQGPRTQQLPTDEPPAPPATRDRRPRKAGRPRR
ncbi:MAG: hypothetical protein WKF57_20840, partial [Nakamurella sp.]